MAISLVLVQKIKVPGILKSIKNRSKINQKNIQKIDKFWDDFGRILEAKMAPKSMKNRSKEQSKFWSNFGSIFHRFFVDFGLHVGPPRGGRTGGRAHFWCSCWLLGPRWPPDPPKTASRTNFGPILVDFWTMFARCWTIFDLFVFVVLQFSIIFWIYFWTILINFWRCLIDLCVFLDR